MNKALVVYYSFEGTTEFIAKSISESLNIDLLSIMPIKELKSKGFSKFVWGGAQVVMGVVPEIESINIDLSLYDTILLGSPIWAGTYAPPIRTFLKSKELVNKKIAYFYTHDGGASRAEERAKETIILHNTYIGAMGFENVNSHREESKQIAIDWARSII